MKTFTDGAWIAAKSDKADPIIAPSTPKLLENVWRTGPADVEATMRENAKTLGTALRRELVGLTEGIMLCEGLEAGLVWLNNIQKSSRYAPFAGVKQSGVEREKGRWDIGTYLEYKTAYLSYEVAQ